MREVGYTPVRFSQGQAERGKGRSFYLETELFLPLAAEEIFPFFGDAANLEAITPPWLHFQIKTPQPIDMEAGTLIDYQISLHGIPLNWRTRISAWEPSSRFIDEQLRGPYCLWVHEHTFEPVDGGCLCKDRVEYQVLGGSIIEGLFVRKDLERIFAYRQEQILAHFKPRVEAQPTAG